MIGDGWWTHPDVAGHGSAVGSTGGLWQQRDNGDIVWQM